MFTCANMRHSVPTRGNIAVGQLWANPFRDGVLVLDEGDFCRFVY